MSFTIFDPEPFVQSARPLLIELDQCADLTHEAFSKILKKHPQKGGKLFSKDQLIAIYRLIQKTDLTFQLSEKFIDKIKMKPIRTGSGVTPVTVLTKPFPCPGKCIFCPNDIRMPKSYLRDEPGAQRAERNQFDPYLQTMNRLIAYKHIGHITDKVEIIILGGTWSFYPEPYQIWYVKRCFDAMNDFSTGSDHREEIEKLYEEKNKKLQVTSRTENDKVTHAVIHGEKLEKSYNQVISEIYTAPDKLLGLDKDQTATWEELFAAHKENETAECRCVGLVIETRPDNISEAEVLRIRKLGCTKTQIGFQSLQDTVLEKNKRGHDVAATRKAVRLLRQAGFKIHAHWMPNLYGSSPEQDIEDYKKMFTDDDFKPDELKIYPCSLIESAELMQYYTKGLWQPYDHDELLHVLTSCFQLTPEYCRLTRVIRDIPSTDIVVGNKKTNFREITEAELKKRGVQSKDIRSREIKQNKVDVSTLQLSEVLYSTSVADEVFLQYVTQDNHIVGFLRLSLPKVPNFQAELEDSAMIREVHVYGNTVGINNEEIPHLVRDDKLLARSQHLGLGKKLIARAREIAKEKGYKKLQVISSVGTREYYRKQGFEDGQLYQYIQL